MKLSSVIVTVGAASPVLALRIASSLQWIEHTPQPYAIKHFYQGTSAATLISGGVANLATDKSIDLAANAETQGLLQLSSHPNLRLVYVICEVTYRLVASQAAGITTLGDLKGKRIGTLPGTSAAYFVSKLLGTVGVRESDYRVVSGNVCMKTPCGAGTLPAMLQGGQVDAFGIWEPVPQLGADALGSKAVVFQNASVYREVYSLYTTADKLADAGKRKDIVAFVRALNQTLDVFTNKPETVYATVAQAVGMDAAVVKAVWPQHKWSGRWGPELLDFIAEEDKWVAKQNNRATLARSVLSSFLDTSVVDEL